MNVSDRCQCLKSSVGNGREDNIIYNMGLGWVSPKSRIPYEVNPAKNYLRSCKVDDVGTSLIRAATVQIQAKYL